MDDGGRGTCPGPRSLGLGVALDGGVHGGDGDLDLAVVRGAGRHRLQGEAGKGARPHERVACVRGVHPYHLVGDARYHGDEDDAGGDAERQVRRAEEREHDDGHDHHGEQECGAAARVRRREEPHVLVLQRESRLLGVDGHVLRGVVAEDALDARHEADDRQVGEEDGEAQDALRRVAQDGIVGEAVDVAVRDEQRQDEEEADAEHEGGRERERHRERRDRLFVVLGLAGGDLG